MSMEILDLILKISPVFVIVTLALVLLVLNFFKSEIPKVVIIALFSLFALYFAALGLVIPDSDDTEYIILHADGITFTFYLILLFAYFLCSCLNNNQLKNQRAEETIDVDVLMALALSGAMTMISAANFIVLFVGLEIMSLAIYALSGISRKEKASTEASLKYFIMGAFASAFLVFGFAMIYGVTGSLDIALYKPEGSTMLYAALGLVIFGFAFKIGLAPFHYWVADIYQGAPTTITAFMSVIAKAAGIAALLRLLGGCFFEISNAWVVVLAILSAISMIVGNLLALRQDSVKRMLAYSGIAHAGYMFMAVAALNVKAMSYDAVSFYLFSYAPAIIGAFAVVLIVTGGTDRQYDRDSLSSFRGLGWKSPWIGVAMTLFLLSLTGIPPLAGFIGKIYVFEAAIGSKKIPLTVFAALNVIIAAYYYLRVVVVMYAKDKKDKDTMLSKEGAENAVLRASAAPRFVLVITSLAVVVFGIYASAFKYVSHFQENVWGINKPGEHKIGERHSFKLSR